MVTDHIQGSYHLPQFITCPHLIQDLPGNNVRYLPCLCQCYIEKYQEISRNNINEVVNKKGL